MTAGYDNTARFAGSGNALHLTIAADAFLGAADSHEWNTADGHATVIVAALIGYGNKRPIVSRDSRLRRLRSGSTSRLRFRLTKLASEAVDSRTAVSFG